MRFTNKKLLVIAVAGAMMITGAGKAQASGSLVNSGPGVSLGENYQPDESVSSDGTQTEGKNQQESQNQDRGSSEITGTDRITYRTVKFPGLKAVYRMGKGSQITNVVLSLDHLEGNIGYDAYVNNGGWQPWTFNDQPTGGMEDSTYLEGFRIMPRNGLEKQYDIYYASTMSGLGKLGYAKNGEMSGAPGRGEHVTDMDIVLVPKGEPAPGSTKHPFVTVYHDQITNEEGALRYSDPSYTGWLDQEGFRWYVDHGVVATGWRYIDGYKFYFQENGLLVQDVDSIIGKQPSYEIKINKQMNCLTVYAPDGDNGYIIPVKAMVTSVGDDTPIGTFKTPEKHRWREMVTGAYSQYATRMIKGKGFLIHSVIFDIPDNQTLWTDTFNGLGVLRSLGCVRLNTGNAKWIYDNCAVGTAVTVYESETASPFSKPGTIPLPEGQLYDPTDPDA